MTNQAPQQNQIQIGIAKIYVKDLSFESPAAPQVFRDGWQPKVKLDVAVNPRHIQENLWEVSLDMTVEAKEGENVSFIVEVEQAGLFEIQAPEGPQLDHILKVFAPTTLFPYARQMVDLALNQGGFPPLMLAPVNFEGMLRQNGR